MYKAYKKHQESIQNILDDPGLLEKFDDINKLLSIHSRLTKQYELRDKYRQVAFTPKFWDSGHRNFLNLLLDVIERCTHRLTDLFNKTHHPMNVEEQSEPASEAEAEVVIQKIVIDNAARLKIENEVWNVLIPKAIQERQDYLARVSHLLGLIKRLFESICGPIDEKMTCLLILQWVNLQTLLNRMKNGKIVNKNGRTIHVYAMTIVNVAVCSFEKFRFDLVFFRSIYESFLYAKDDPQFIHLLIHYYTKYTPRLNQKYILQLNHSESVEEDPSYRIIVTKIDELEDNVERIPPKIIGKTIYNLLSPAPCLI